MFEILIWVKLKQNKIEIIAKMTDGQEVIAPQVKKYSNQSLVESVKNLYLNMKTHLVHLLISC